MINAPRMFLAMAAETLENARIVGINEVKTVTPRGGCNRTLVE